MLNPEAVKTHQLLPVVARGLTYIAGGKARLSGVDLEIAEPGITVIMGPNGAGKSLLIRLLHGLITPHAGDISWNGAPLNRVIKKQQTMVFQKPVLLRRSVRANIEFVLKLTKNRQRNADELLDLAGLSGRAKQPARSLSGGEQQRLALVRALAADPRILFLDEPTASLDPASILRIEMIVAGAAKQGIKIILVTHDIAQAKRVGADMIFMHLGQVVGHRPAAEFFDNPMSAEAAAFLQGRLLV